MAKYKRIEGYARCEVCGQAFNKLEWLIDHIKEKHPRKAKKLGLVI